MNTNLYIRIDIVVPRILSFPRFESPWVVTDLQHCTRTIQPVIMRIRKWNQQRSMFYLAFFSKNDSTHVFYLGTVIYFLQLPINQYDDLKNNTFE